MSSLAAADYEYEAMAEYEALAEIVHQNFEWFYQFAEESERAGDYSNLIGLIVALVKWIETSYAVGYYLYKVIEPNGACRVCFFASTFPYATNLSIFLVLSGLRLEVLCRWMRELLQCWHLGK